MKASRLLEIARQQQVRDKLVPGRIIHHQFMFGTPPKPHPKFAIYLGVLWYEAQFLIINTRPAPYIQANKHLLDDQIAIDMASHQFLDYDSTIACHSVEGVRIQEIHSALVVRPEDLKSMLSNECRVKVCETVSNSVNLEPFLQKFIVTALKP